jgi:CBS domain-containing protein
MTSATVTDAADDTLAEAASKMWGQQTGSLVVCSGDRIEGIVTERDVLKTIASGQDPKSVTVRDVMSTDVVTVSPDVALRDAAQIMFDKWFRHLPVVGENGTLVGILSLRDLLTILAEGMDEPASLQALTGHKLVRDRRLERVEAGDLD